jgi:hypothetical protein
LADVELDTAGFRLADAELDHTAGFRLADVELVLAGFRLADAELDTAVRVSVGGCRT